MSFYIFSIYFSKDKLFLFIQWFVYQYFSTLLNICFIETHCTLYKLIKISNLPLIKYMYTIED